MNNTYNPLQKEVISRNFFEDRLMPDLNTTLVFCGRKRELLIVRQGDRKPNILEKIWRVYDEVYKVDIGEHKLQFRCELPSSMDAFYFCAEVQFTCFVNNPALIVSKNITNVLDYIEPIITHIMRSRSRKYTLDQNSIAEKEIFFAIRQEISSCGFELKNMVLKLTQSNLVITHRYFKQERLAEIQESQLQELQEEIKQIKRHINKNDISSLVKKIYDSDYRNRFNPRIYRILNIEVDEKQWIETISMLVRSGQATEKLELTCPNCHEVIDSYTRYQDIPLDQVIRCIHCNHEFEVSEKHIIPMYSFSDNFDPMQELSVPEKYFGSLAKKD